MQPILGPCSECGSNDTYHDPSHRKQSINKIMAICKFLNFTSPNLSEVLDPIYRAHNDADMQDALNDSKRALATQLKIQFEIERDIVQLKEGFKNIAKPAEWDDLLDLYTIFLKLDRIEPVSTQDEINQADALKRLLQFCVNNHYYDEIIRIADSHTMTPATRGWLFCHVIKLIISSLNENLLIEYQLDKTRAFYEQIPETGDHHSIVEPNYKWLAAGAISEAYFMFGDSKYGFTYVYWINNALKRQWRLERALNILFDKSELETCCKIAAALRDLKQNLRTGFSSIDEGIEALQDKEMRKCLSEFYSKNKSNF